MLLEAQAHHKKLLKTFETAGKRKAEKISQILLENIIGFDNNSTATNATKETQKQEA